MTTEHLQAPEPEDRWLSPEEIERRGRPRGIVHGLRLVLDGAQRLEAVEVSTAGFFAALDDPERFRLGDRHEVEAIRGEVRFRCEVEVVREERGPRRGVALRVVAIGSDAQQLLAGLVCAS